MGALTLYGQIADRRDRSAERMSDWFSLENWPPLSQKGLNPIVDVEDLSMVLARLESGVFISYQQCHYTPDYWRNFTVIGTEGRLENSGDSGGEIRVWNRRHASAAPPDLTYEIPGDGGIGHDEADLACLVEFFGFARTRATTVTSPVGARYAVAAGVAATDSLRANSRLGTIAAVPAPLRNYFREGQQPHTREEREDMGLTS